MKKILLAIAVFLSFNAHADSWAMPNEGGGEITLSSDACMADGGKWSAKLKKAYSWTNRIYFEGCWGIVDGNVHVIWLLPDGTRPRNVYNINSFSRKV
jgi:hypothetical protein